MSQVNPPSFDIKDMLVDMFSASDSSAAFDLTFGDNLFLASLPNMPHNAVCIYDTGGLPQMQYDLERPNVQIRVRHTNYEIGYALIRDIKYHLHQARNGEVWNGTIYIQIETRSDILYLGQDEKNRHSWTLNFGIWRSGN